MAAAAAKRNRVIVEPTYEAFKFTIQAHVHKKDAKGKVIGETVGQPVEMYGSKLDGALARQFDRALARGLKGLSEAPAEKE